MSFWSCFSIFLLASLCAFSSFRWSSVLLLPRQPIFPETQLSQVQGRGKWDGWACEEQGKVLIRRFCFYKKKKLINPKFLDRPSGGTPGSKWVTSMLPDGDGADLKDLLGDERWTPTRLWSRDVCVCVCVAGWMDVAICWQILNKRSQEKWSRATMPPSQTPDSGVFHCKSAMKSSTLM